MGLLRQVHLLDTELDYTPKNDCQGPIDHISFYMGESMSVTWEDMARSKDEGGDQPTELL